MDCSSNQRARQGARCLLDVLPAELFPLVAQLLPAADLGRTEATSRALRAAVERAVRERAAEWGGFGTGAAQRVGGKRRTQNGETNLPGVAIIDKALGSCSAVETSHETFHKIVTTQ